MEQHRVWCVNTLQVILVMFIIIASITAIIDPFCHYHKPFKGILISREQAYLNPGLVNLFEYDSLITGSSMVENFKTSYFKEVLGVDAIKAPYSGGSAKNMNAIMNKALKSNPNLKTIYLGLDLPMLRRDPEKTIFPLPYYLYDSNPFSDVSYLLNKDVLCKIDTYFEDGYNILRSIRGGIDNTFEFSFDDYSSWRHVFNFSQYTTVKPFMNETKADIPDLPSDEILRLPHDNLRMNILPLIESYPKTDFVIFFPPYSILYWYSSNVKNEITILEYSIKTLLSYDNVKLYLFQNIPEIVTNLYHYKDYSHYNVNINDYMVDCFKNGAHQITKDNYETELEKMKDLAEKFDYGVLFGESNPFILEDDIPTYLAKLNVPRYLTFIITRADESIDVYNTLHNHHAQLALNNSVNSSGYAAVIQGNNVIYEESNEEAILYNDNIYGLSVNMVSEKRNGKNYVEVGINGVKYTTNQEGINIVVYDAELGRVMDNIAINIDDNVINRR